MHELYHSLPVFGWREARVCWRQRGFRLLPVNPEGFEWLNRNLGPKEGYHQPYDNFSQSYQAKYTQNRENAVIE